MMSRYNGPSRDRSPPRFDRRASFTSHNHQSFRAGSEAAQGPTREIPRGPKADSLRQSGPPPPRGRGAFTSRGDFRDREGPPPFRRDGDRPDWNRRDRDYNFGERESSQSRDSRPFHLRDRSLSPGRSARDAKDSSQSGLPAWHGSAGRGAPRGRGRGDWDRGRGRGYQTEREGIGARSRSRDGWRERDRPWEHSDADARDRFSRRETDRQREGDDRGDFGWRQERSPTRNSLVNQSTLPRLSSSGPTSYVPLSEQGRRFSSNLVGSRDKGREDESPTSLSTTTTDSARRIISPPPAPPVPAFGGSLDFGKSVKLEPSVNAVPTAEKSPIAPHARLMEKSQVETPFQPPTGPRADRTASGQKVLGRPIRPSTASTPTTPSAAFGSLRYDNQEAFGSSTKLFANKQLTLKPAVQSPSSLSIRSDHISKGLPRTPTTIPTGPAAMEGSPTTPRSAIPTGPRLQGKLYPTWAPGYKIPNAPTRPSIMNSAPSKPAQSMRNYGLPAAQRNNADPFVGQNIKTRPDNVWRRDPDAPRPGSSASNLSEKVPFVPEQPPKESGFLAMSLDQSSDDEGDDDGLDEEDFADSERKHQKEIDRLMARRPPTSLHDPIVVNLLIRIQLLSMIVDGHAPADLEPSGPMEVTGVDSKTIPTGLPSPGSEEGVEDLPILTGRFLKEPPYKPIPTPPLENLPFLSDTIEDGQRYFDVSDGEEDLFDSLTTPLFRHLSFVARDEEEEELALRSKYWTLYPPWKAETTVLDRRFRENNPLTPAPASPPASVTATAVATPSIEKTRGAKNTTELDFQNALKASEESAREEQERRDRELMAKSNLETEAVVPSMLPPSQADVGFFEDRNQLISVEHCLDLFAFVPPQDDFTPEEQKAFIVAFNSTPKKWSEIADNLPGRDFQQCILHYYLTKHVARYKEIYKKTLPKKKRGRGPNARTRVPTLMPDIVFDREDADGTPPAVTDTGRPKRAAAPTFGEVVAEAEVPVIAATSRRGAREQNGDPTADKPTGRKRGGPKGTRKAKAAAAIAGQSPQKVEKEPKPARATLKAEIKPVDLAPDLPRQLPTSDLRGSTALSGAPDAGGANRPAAQGRNANSQYNSYWSVPESTYFPTLVDYFGRDWPGIANFMKTKTAAMVKNFFVREAGNHPNLMLEDRARAAEERKQRGESPGLTLEAIPPPKRKYDTAPANQRSSEMDRKVEIATKTKAATVEDFAPAVGPRGITNDGKPTLGHATQIRPVAAVSVPSRAIEGTVGAPVPRPNQGPRAGYFADERRTPMLSQSAMQPLAVGVSPQGQNRPQRDQPFHTQQVPKPIQTSPAHAPTHQTIYASPQRTGLLSQSQQSMRGGGLESAAPVHAMLKHESDSHTRRAENSDSRIPFSALSPTSARFSNQYGPPLEPARPHSTPAQPVAASQRLAAPKRSNLMNLLNDEQPKSPPRKRPGAELERTPSYPASYPREATRLPSSTQREDLVRQQARSPYDLLDHGRPQPMAPLEATQTLPPHRTGLGAEEKPVAYDEAWRKWLDPRQQSSASSPDQPLRAPIYSSQSASNSSLGHQPAPNTPGGSLSNQTSYQHRMSSLHSIRPASPVASSTQPHYQPPRSASSQGSHSRIPSYNQSQSHLHQAPVVTSSQPAPAQTPGSSRPPSVSYDSRSILIEHRQPESYNYTLPQQSKQQSQPQIQPQRPEWQSHSAGQVKLLQHQSPQHQLQAQQPQTHQRAPQENPATHPLRSQQIQQQQTQQLPADGHRNEQTYYSSQPQSQAQSQPRPFGMQSYPTHQPQQPQLQHGRSNHGQGHARHYSHGGAEGSR